MENGRIILREGLTVWGIVFVVLSVVVCGLLLVVDIKDKEVAEREKVIEDYIHELSGEIVGYSYEESSEVDKVLSEGKLYEVVVLGEDKKERTHLLEIDNGVLVNAVKDWK